MSKTIPEFPAADTPLSSSDLMLVWQNGLKRAELGDAAGLVVESGSNSDGLWLRFANGWQIARNTAVASSLDVTSADGELFRSANQTWTYPVAFVGTPNVIPNLRRVGGPTQISWAGVSDYGTSSATIHIIAATSHTPLDYVLACTAIGRWF